MTTLAFPQELFERLANWLDEADETAGVLLLRRGAKGKVFVARDLIEVPAEFYEERSRNRMVIRSGGYVPALGAAERRGDMACFVHSHPHMNASPSTHDDRVDEQLTPLFQLRTRQEPYVSVIIGGTKEEPSLRARVYKSEGPPTEIEKFRIVGKRLIILRASPGSAPLPAFDRHVRAFGQDGQRLLRDLRVGVVGAGGTGSAVVEQLLRLGVGELVIADPDTVTETNITRIHQSSATDVGNAKVNVAARLAGELGFGSTVTIFDGKVTQERIATAFAECDVIFGCTDDHAGRAVLSRLAYWYLLPVLDVGVVVDSSEGRIRGVYERLTIAAPGYPCLLCRGVVDPIAMRNEMLAPGERAAREAEGYVPELGDPDPSVVSYTSLIASLAISEFLARLFGIEDEAPGELLLRLHDHKLSAVAGAPRPGHYCADPTEWGRADEAPFLGQTW